MSNAKRAIMVPVMTLAVCAIAMVGLGFALTSSVVTDNNVVGKLMVDLNDDGDFGSATEPTAEKIDNLLQSGVQSVKTTTEDGTYTVTKTLFSKIAYMKIFGNMTGVTLNVSVGGMSDTGVKNLQIKVKGTGTNSTFEATADVEKVGEVYKATFKNNSSKPDIFASGQIYTVQVVEINGVGIGDLDQSEETALGNITGIDLSFTFEAVSDNTTNA